jgi:small subunit ribosomal protein S6
VAEQAPLYDLLLLLSTEAPPEQRERILSMVQSAVQTANGDVERDDQWGRRPLAYEIRHQTDADYHLLQFHAPGSLIEELSHTLRITDGVMRFRIIKVRPGTPAAKSGAPPVVAAVAAGGSAETSGPDAPSTSAEADEGGEEGSSGESLSEESSGDEYSDEA